jgi:hypothetical protein
VIRRTILFSIRSAKNGKLEQKERGGIIFSLVLSLGFNLLFGVNDLLGQGVLFNFVAGRYRRPRVEAALAKNQSASRQFFYP